MPATSDSGAYSEYVMVFPGSTNIAPPPLIRRTTVMPSRLASAVSTSLRSDWKLPMTTAGADHSQIRSVGGRRPAATSRASTSSSAMCSAGSWGSVADEPPVVIAPAAGPGEGAPDRGRHCPRRDPGQHGVAAERGRDLRRDHAGVRVAGIPVRAALT